MFGIGRRKSQGQLAKAELNQGLGHLMQAATYAANDVGARVGPRVQVARGRVAPAAALVRDRASSGWGATITTFAPLAAATRDGALQAGSVARKAKSKNMRMTQKKKPRKRGSMMTGLLAVGAVAGVAGAMAIRRRREQQEWAEYDPAQSLNPVGEEVDLMVLETPATANGSTAGSTAEQANQTTGNSENIPSSKSSFLHESAKQTAGESTDKGDGVLGSTPSGTASTPSGNNRH